MLEGVKLKPQMEVRKNIRNRPLKPDLSVGSWLINDGLNTILCSPHTSIQISVNLQVESIQITPST